MPGYTQPLVLPPVTANFTAGVYVAQASRTAQGAAETLHEPGKENEAKAKPAALNPTLRHDADFSPSVLISDVSPSNQRGVRPRLELPEPVVERGRRGRGRPRGSRSTRGTRQRGRGPGRPRGSRARGRGAVGGGRRVLDSSSESEPEELPEEFLDHDSVLASREHQQTIQAQATAACMAAAAGGAGAQEVLCTICCDGPRSHAAAPCGHKLFCGSCVTRLGNTPDIVCPACRRDVIMFLHIFDNA